MIERAIVDVLDAIQANVKDEGSAQRVFVLSAQRNLEPVVASLPAVVRSAYVDDYSATQLSDEQRACIVGVLLACVMHSLMSARGYLLAGNDKHAAEHVESARAMLRDVWAALTAK